MSKRRRRDHSPIATDPVSRFLGPTPPPSYQTFTDARQYHPEAAYRPLLSFDGVPATITTEDRTNVRRPRRSDPRNPINRATSAGRLVFAETPPDRVRALSPGLPVCVRREQRREVLFAKGKGGSRHKRKVRRNPNSKIGC